MKRWLFILLSSMLIMGAACGDDGGDDGTEAGSEQETEDTPTDEPTEDETAGGTLTVSGVDFAFKVDPASLPAGETEVTFTNDGKEPHQMIMARLSEDAPAIDELIKMSEKESGKFLEENFEQAAKPIKPGQSTTFTADLQAGNYGLVCFVSNKEGPHALQGMFGSFVVE